LTLLEAEEGERKVIAHISTTMKRRGEGKSSTRIESQRIEESEALTHPEAASQS